MSEKCFLRIQYLNFFFLYSWKRICSHAFLLLLIPHHLISFSATSSPSSPPHLLPHLISFSSLSSFSPPPHLFLTSSSPCLPPLLLLFFLLSFSTSSSSSPPHLFSFSTSSSPFTSPHLLPYILVFFSIYFLPHQCSPRLPSPCFLLPFSLIHFIDLSFLSHSSLELLVPYGPLIA